MTPLLEFHRVTRDFSGVLALRAASFRVPAGTITALLGPNGAGKSTALKIALNLLHPSSGDVTILGSDSRKLGPAQLARIGYVAEGMELPDWMSVDEFFPACPPPAIYPLTLRELFITRVRTGRGDVRGKPGISR